MERFFLVSLFIFIIFGFKAQACGTNTVARIEECTLDDRLKPLLTELGYKRKDYKFSRKSGQFDTRSLYERLIMQDKPTLDFFEAALSTWKLDQTARLNYKNRFKNINNLREAMTKCNISEPNAKLFAKRLQDTMDEGSLSCLEEKQVEIDAELAAQKATEDSYIKVKEDLKSYNCSKLGTKFQKLTCAYIKGQL